MRDQCFVYVKNGKRLVKGIGNEDLRYLWCSALASHHLYSKALGCRSLLPVRITAHSTIFAIHRKQRMQSRMLVCIIFTKGGRRVV